MPIVFDGAARTIQLDPTTLFYTPEGIYSRWKQWVIQGDNAKWPAAFRIVGGDPLGGGSTTPSFVFLQNQEGWRIKKPEANINVTINGNLVKEDPQGGFDLPPDGNFSPSLTLNLFSVASADVMGEQVTEGVTLQQVLKELWQMRGLDSTNPVTVTPTTETVDNITLDVGGDGVTSSTLTRRP
jgi:hypothetical protein